MTGRPEDSALRLHAGPAENIAPRDAGFESPADVIEWPGTAHRGSHDTVTPMAGKLSDSIRRNLDKLRKAIGGGQEPRPKQAAKPAPARKDPVAAQPSAKAGSSEAAPPAAPGRKKAANQPWYRHGKRW